MNIKHDRTDFSVLSHGLSQHEHVRIKWWILVDFHLIFTLFSMGMHFPHFLTTKITASRFRWICFRLFIFANLFCLVWYIWSVDAISQKLTVNRFTLNIGSNVTDNESPPVWEWLYGRCREGDTAAVGPKRMSLSTLGLLLFSSHDL